MNNLKKSFIILLLSPYIISGAMSDTLEEEVARLEETILLDDLSNAETLLQQDLAFMNNHQTPRGTFKDRSLKKMAELTKLMLRYYKPNAYSTVENEKFRKYLNAYRKKVATIHNLLQTSKGMFGRRSLQSQINIDKEIEYLNTLLGYVFDEVEEMSSISTGRMLIDNDY